MGGARRRSAELAADDAAAAVIARSHPRAVERYRLGVLRAASAAPYDPELARSARQVLDDPVSMAAIDKARRRAEWAPRDWLR